MLKIDSPKKINPSQKSRAEYFRKRRENTKQFSVTLNRSKLEDLESYLEYNNKTKTDWLNEKIDEELNK
ncbi:hypothetical protein [Clostridium sp. VAP52]|uniref:hypothetical protein n=1 Tax=Clostridium sp. VAP52 TaxID=2949977 RepID=UPI0020798FB3|nr:hypothetical protein [Clostridium sp. VAP52]